MEIELKEFFGEPTEGTFIERENRFTAKVLVKNEIKRAHISDTGRLEDLLVFGVPALLSPNPKGKLDYKLVSVKSEEGWILVNTHVHSLVAERLIREGVLGFKPENIEKEVKVGNSRIDFLIEGKLFLEVKGCNLSKNGTCLFPDAPTERGKKHLEELIKLKDLGFEAGIMILSFRKCKCFLPNKSIDPEFSKVFWEGLSQGIKFFGFKIGFCRESFKLKLLGNLEICTRPF